MKKHLISLILFSCSMYAQIGSPYVIVDYDSVEIGIIDMARNCGAKYAMEAQLNDSLLTVAAVDTGQMAFCESCYFDASITIGGLEPGNYYVNIYSYDNSGWDNTLDTWIRDTTFIGSLTFSIIVNSTNDYKILSTYQSGCSHSGGVDEETVPTEFASLNNYPNPFNSSTKIEFHLPFNETAEMSVYDVNGKKVTTLFNKYYSAGNHSLLWKATDISSGMYFLTISTKSYSQSKKILLLK